MKKGVVISSIVAMLTVFLSSAIPVNAQVISGYWYENGMIQGSESDSKCVSYDGTVRGREVYDPEADAWYWLDANRGGAIAKNKEVFTPYVYQNEEDLEMPEYWDVIKRSGECYKVIDRMIIDKEGKWVRYDENGKMIKGWWVSTKGRISEAPTSPADFTEDENVYYYDLITGAMIKNAEIEISGYAYSFDSDGLLYGIRKLDPR